MADQEDAVDFSALSLEELYEQMGDDLYDGLADEVAEAVNEALGRGRDAYEVMTEGLVAGMDVVGADFRDGIIFVPEVLMAAKAMKGDRRKCLDVGANDYLSKPIDMDKLLSLLRVWLY